MSRRAVSLGLAAAVLSGSGLAVLIRAERGGAGEAPPGLTAGVNALDKLPAVASVPQKVREMLGVMSSDVGESAAAVEHRTRLLRSDLPGRSGFYAFRSKTGSACFIIEKHSALCPKKLTAGGSGLLFSIGGGTDDAPPALVGIAADNVASVTLVIDGVRKQPVSIKNNAAYAELPTSAKTGAVIVNYNDGSKPETYAIHLQDTSLPTG